MMRNSDRTQPLKGRSAWLITDGKIGMDVQVRGVADALGLDYEIKHVAPCGLWRALAPWAPVAPRERFGQPGTPFAPPWPEVALATGRLSIPYIRAVGRRAGAKTYRVVLQDPKTSPAIADLIWVPEHDKRRGANVITTLTAAHSFSPERLVQLRAASGDILDLPSPRVAVVLGGPNSIYEFRGEDIDRLRLSLSAMSPHAGSFLITPSRRTPEALLAAVSQATDGKPRMLWDGSGDNPYGQFLASADVFVVTADSVNMVGEATATGQPVYVFEPTGGSAKFKRFHEALRRYGATRPLPVSCSQIATWTYAPLDSAREIAHEVEQRWLGRTAMPPMYGSSKS